MTTQPNDATHAVIATLDNDAALYEGVQKYLETREAVSYKDLVEYLELDGAATEFSHGDGTPYYFTGDGVDGEYLDEWLSEQL